MKLFITGSMGFIGQHVVKRLHSDGHKLLLFVHHKTELFSDLTNVTFIEGDLIDVENYREEISRFNPEAVIHLAWQGIPDYGAENCKKNLEMSLNLIMLAKDAGCEKFISTGSCWEYGVGKGKLSESMAVREKNVFTATKNSLYQIGKQIAKEKDMTFVWLRLFYVYGPGQRGRSIIPTIIHAIKNGEEPGINNLLNKNDFVYVEDVADAISAVVKKEDIKGIFNVGSGSTTSLKQILDMIYTAFGKQTASDDGNNKVDGVANDDKDDKSGDSGADLDFYADISKIKEETGWVPKTTILEGLTKTIHYMENKR